MSFDAERTEPPALALPIGPFWSSCGPADGPIRERYNLPGCIGLHPADPSEVSIPFKAKWQCGIAYAVGRMADRRGPITVYRLTVGKADVHRWICVGGRFVRLGEAAEYVGEGRNPPPDHCGWGPEPY